jgi:tRNA dimethylallyltransferase
MQVYRGMDIGTAKPDLEARKRFGYHLVDLVDPWEELTVADYQRHGETVIASAGDEPLVLAGGSGLHLRALVDPLEFPPTDDGLRAELEEEAPRALLDELLGADPGAGDVVDLANPRRVLRAVEVYRLTGATPTERVASAPGVAVRDYEPSRPFVGIGVDPGQELAGRVERRFDRMLADGLLEEVAGLSERMGRTARQAVGYQQLLPVVSGEATLTEARERAIRATLSLAKRQRTYFRRDPRVSWLPWHHEPRERVEAAVSQIEGAWIS